MARHHHTTDGPESAAGTDRPHDHREATRDPAKHRQMPTEEIASAYDDLADAFDRWGWLERLFAGRYRRRQFDDAEGRVLDVACGTGTNVRYLPESVDYVGIDVSEAMLEKAGAELDALGRDGDLQRMDAQELAFPDDHFDTVVSALSTCTFPDPVAALREMERVCKPDGRILLLEHGLSDVGPVARFQEWRAEAHYESAGCRWDQEPVALVERAGLPVDEARTAFLGMITAIESRPGREMGDG